MIGTAAYHRVDFAMIILESLIIVAQQRDILLEAIASLLWIRCQRNHLPLKEGCRSEPLSSNIISPLRSPGCPSPFTGREERRSLFGAWDGCSNTCSFNRFICLTCG